MRAPTLALLLLASLPGCKSYLQPMDNTPLPALRPVAAEGGGTLEIDGRGRLVLRPDPASFEAAWGVSLENTDDGVRVAARVSATSALEEGDLIRRVRAGAFLTRLSDRRKSPASIADVRSHGSPVASTRDLEGYGLAWSEIDLLVDRDGDEQVVAQEIARPQELPVHRFKPQSTQHRGFELLRMDRWNADWRPKAARPTDVLLTHVGRESLMGLSGFRPLDVIRPAKDYESMFDESGEVDWELRSAVSPEDYLDDLTLDEFDEGLGVRVIRKEEELWRTFPKWNWMTYVDAELPWIPGLFAYETDKFRKHIGIGPIDLLLHYHSKRSYNSRTDSYDLLKSYSFLSVIQVTSHSGEDSEFSSYGLNPIVDGPKYFYYADRVTGD